MPSVVTNCYIFIRKELFSWEPKMRRLCICLLSSPNAIISVKRVVLQHWKEDMSRKQLLHQHESIQFTEVRKKVVRSGFRQKLMLRRRKRSDEDMSVTPYFRATDLTLEICLLIAKWSKLFALKINSLCAFSTDMGYYVIYYMGKHYELRVRNGWEVVEFDNLERRLYVARNKQKGLLR